MQLLLSHYVSVIYGVNFPFNDLNWNWSFWSTSCLLAALQRAQARPPTEPEAEEVLQRWSWALPAQTPGSNTVVIFTKESLAKPSLFSFWKDNARYGKKRRKETRLRTIRRCQVVRSCLWHILSVLGHCLLQKESRIFDGSKTKPCLIFFCKFLACLLPCRGSKPDRRRSQRRRRCCNADRGLSPPKPPAAIQLQFSPRSPSPNLRSFPFEKTTRGIKKKGKKQDYSPYENARSYARQTFSCSWKGTKISAEGDVDSHVSLRKLEKALKSVLREMPIRTFLEKFRLDQLVGPL